jgi:shikimate kinase
MLFNDEPAGEFKQVSLIAHLIGPGGAGKTTVGAILANRLNWRFVDMDQCFLASIGDISEFIDRHGYLQYAARNVQLYTRIRDDALAPTVCAVSSGFMTYPEYVAPIYSSLRDSIEANALTALLMPTFELKTCTDLIVARQLARTYLNAIEASETTKIHNRFPLYMRLGCSRFQSDVPPEQVAERIERFVLNAFSYAE